jgi:hypothetical protein
MTRDNVRRPRRGAATIEPAVEPLEGRTLLSHFFAGATPIRPVQTTGGLYLLTMNGPGLEKVQHQKGGSIAITLYGTTTSSTLDVSQTRTRPHVAAGPLQISSIRVVSGELGGIVAPVAALEGPMTPLSGGASTLQFQTLGPNAQIDVNGSLGSLSLAGATLGRSGHVRIAGDVLSSLSIGGPLSIDRGSFVVGHDLAGSLSVGSVSLTRGGAFVVGHDLSGGATVTGNLAITSQGVLSVGHDLGGLTVGQGAALDSGGLLAVGNDVTGAVTVTGALSLSNGAKVLVGRDTTGAIQVNGDMTLASGSAFGVGRNVSSLTVNGDLTESGKATITVGGNLSNLTVNGAYTGNNSPNTIDLSVGLDLGALTVLSGGAGQGGLRDANINVAKSILGLNIPHGIFDSWITAGVLIDGGTASTVQIGPDGADAVVNSDIRAGVEINHLTIGGNVISTFVANPKSAGYPTRIVAGEDRIGNYTAGGQIDNFQITGALVDSVIAASVAPFGGDGNLPTDGYDPSTPPVIPAGGSGDNGNNTYDAPAGTITGGTVGSPIKFATFTPVVIYNETPTGVAWNTTLDPTIDDAILPGAINKSFASGPLPASTVSGPNANPDAVLPLPTKSTVLGGVISTKHGDENDFAGIVAADTTGVFVGTLPAASSGTTG